MKKKRSYKFFILGRLSVPTLEQTTQQCLFPHCLTLCSSGWVVRLLPNLINQLIWLVFEGSLIFRSGILKGDDINLK